MMIFSVSIGVYESKLISACAALLRFIRDEDAGEESSPSSSTKGKSWEEALALKYEASLFREFAVCDLKHYKLGNVSLQRYILSLVMCPNAPRYPQSHPL